MLLSPQKASDATGLNVGYEYINELVLVIGKRIFKKPDLKMQLISEAVFGNTFACIIPPEVQSMCSTEEGMTSLGNCCKINLRKQSQSSLFENVLRCLS